MPRIYDSRKRILVTGGTGFIGSHLIDRLLREAHEVICVDNLFTGTRRNIEHLLGNPRFEFIRHVIRMMQTDDTVTGPINIGNPQEFTILELARLVTGLMGGGAKLVNRPLPVGDPRQRRPDISAAQRLLHWEPAVQLSEGLRPTVEDLRLRLGEIEAAMAREPEADPARRRDARSTHGD